MANQDAEGDIDLHLKLAEHRILTVGQIAAIHGTNTQIVRRRLNEPECEGLIQMAQLQVGARRPALPED